MKIVVAGPGALGCLFAAKIACCSAHEVWLLDHHKKRAANLAESGVTLVEGEKHSRVQVKVSSDPEQIGGADVTLLCVKSHDVAQSLAQVSLLASDDNLLITLQNGIAHHKVLAAEYSGAWAVGVTAQGASLLNPGKVKHGGNGKTFLGFISENQNYDLLQDIASLFNELGMETEVSKDISKQIWNKFIVNVGINALTVLLNAPNGKILDSASGRTRMVLAVKEAAQVAAAKGVKVTDDPVAMTEKVCKATAENISSMLQDVRAGRRTEIDAINGALLQEAAPLGVNVPENEKLVREIKEIEAGYIDR